MKKVVIHPVYARYADFIHRVSDIFYAEGKTIFKARNELKVFEQPGIKFVVKSFKVPHFFNQVVYSTVRASKAERAYRYALILISKGIATPTPVAYVEVRKCGLLFDSYFVSIKSRFYREIRELVHAPDMPEAHSIITDFARFTAGLHDKGIYHKDYSSGNVLFGKTGEHYDFELVDLNRMKFCKIDMKAGCKNLNRLGFNEKLYRLFAREYAAARGFDPDICETMILKY